VPAHEYSTVDDILEYAQEKGESPFLIICDEIEDSHNLGAIIRTAEACGAHGIIIPKRRNVGLNFIVAKTSCGALEYMKVARVTNLASTIDELKKKNIWVYAADMDGQRWDKTDFSGGVALVVGNEGSGVGRLIKEKCDVTVSLPMLGKVNSLNASVAAGILMYEITRQRLG
jgi:23S rRNA (guanosine2251-2'-O)-methyltransferase